MALVLSCQAHATTIGFLSNNPGNIHASKYIKWQGQIDVDQWNHVVFADLEYGVRAIRINLLSYNKRGINTPLGIATRWISKRATEKERREYASVLCKGGSWKVDSVLDLKDPRVLNHLVKQIIIAENGYESPVR